MDICSSEDIDMSSPKYQWPLEGGVKSYFCYLEIERLDYSDLCCHQPHQRGGYLTYCVRGLGLNPLVPVVDKSTTLFSNF